MANKTNNVNSRNKLKMWLIGCSCLIGGAGIASAIIVPLMLNKSTTPDARTNGQKLVLFGAEDLLIPFQTSYEYKCNYDAIISVEGLPAGMSFNKNTLSIIDVSKFPANTAGEFVMSARTKEKKGWLSCDKIIRYFSSTGYAFLDDKAISVRGGVHNYTIQQNDIVVNDKGDGYHELSIANMNMADDSSVTTIAAIYFNNITKTYNAIADNFCMDLFNLRSIQLPQCESVRKIGNNFMAYCYNLYYINCSSFNNVEKIGSYFFSSCNQLEYAIEPGANSQIQEIGSYFFSDCHNIDFIDLDALKNIKEIPDNFFSGCWSLRSLNLSQLTQVETIGNYFVGDCWSIESINLSGFFNVKTIGNSFLIRCADRLQSLDLHYLSKLESIGHSFLHYDDSLHYINLDGLTSLKEIGDNFMAHTLNLDEIDLSSFGNVTKIGAKFLDHCQGLEKINLRFSNLNSVGEGFLEACLAIRYLDLSNFGNTNAQIGTTGYNSGFLKNCSSLSKIFIGENDWTNFTVTTAGQYGMEGCPNFNWNIIEGSKSSIFWNKMGGQDGNITQWKH